MLFNHGFAVEENGAVEAWLSARDRPEISAIHEDYRLSTRADPMRRPHHMTSSERNHPDTEERLRHTSLYRPDLDLVVHDQHDNVAAYGLFWHDPVTATGLVEPMLTEDDHQRRGLARHVLTTGVALLASAGAQRIKIVYDADNPASVICTAVWGSYPTGPPTCSPARRPHNDHERSARRGVRAVPG